MRDARNAVIGFFATLIVGPPIGGILLGTLYSLIVVGVEGFNLLPGAETGAAEWTSDEVGALLMLPLLFAAFSYMIGGPVALVAAVLVAWWLARRRALLLRHALAFALVGAALVAAVTWLEGDWGLTGRVFYYSCVLAVLSLIASALTYRLFRRMVAPAEPESEPMS